MPIDPELQPDGDDREIHIDDGPGDLHNTPADLPNMTPDSQPQEVPDIHEINEQ